MGADGEAVGFVAPLAWTSDCRPLRTSCYREPERCDCESTDAARLFADLDDFGLASSRPATLVRPAVGVLLTPNVNRWVDAAATRLDCCLSQTISDGVNGWLTTKDLPFDVGKAVEGMAELGFPKLFEVFAMSLP